MNSVRPSDSSEDVFAFEAESPRGAIDSAMADADPIVAALRSAIRSNRLEEALGLFRQHHPTPSDCTSEVEARRFSYAADVARISGHLDSALDLIKKAIEFARQQPCKRLLADALIIEGAIHQVSGNRLSALRSWESSRHVFDFELSDPTGILRASSLIAIAQKSRGKWSAAEETLERALELHRSEIGENVELARTRIIANLAVVKARLGKLAHSRQLCEEVLRRTSTLNLQAARCNATLLRAEHQRLRGEYRAAAADIRGVRAWAVERGDARTEGLCHEYLGDVRMDQGQHGVALRHLERALALARAKFPETDMVCEAQRRRAEALVALQRVEEAGEAAEEALRISHKIGEPYEVALAHRAMAAVLDVRGEGERALLEVTQCIEILADLGEKFERARTLLVRARLLRETGQFDPAIDALEESRRLFGEMELHNWVERAEDQLMGRPDVESPQILTDSRGERMPAPERFGIITQDSRMLAIWRDLVLAAASDMPVLIEGESGTGKELVAQAVHQLSGRRTREFVPVNCGAIPRDMQEAEFFGHARGTFTGATEDRPGLFETANGGTLFLDEIGEMTPAAQVKLLRAIESGQIRRLGDRQQRRIDVRYVAATNVGLQNAIADGRFRSDLYHRLDGFALTIPPLRERRSDIPLLVDHLLNLAKRQYGREMRVGPALMSRLMAQDWPGNVRELKNRVFRAVALSRGGGELSTADFPALVDRELPGAPALATDLAALERARIVRALTEAGWSKSAAARLLNIQRTTLHSRMERLGIPNRKPSRPPREM